MPVPDMSSALGGAGPVAPPTKDAPVGDFSDTPEDDNDAPALDPEFQADCSEVFPDLDSSAMAKLQSMIDARCAAMAGGK